MLDVSGMRNHQANDSEMTELETLLAEIKRDLRGDDFDDEEVTQPYVLVSDLAA